MTTTSWIAAIAIGAVDLAATGLMIALLLRWRRRARDPDDDE